ncbi:molybdenum cofactor biosynthesis enzyme MoaA [Virgibacillus halotolerans]|uniref:HicA family toxin-antitoxin system n=1 Tax=Virgibacillus halotolerans TaxID=1071053 RepID=UPI001961802A|nr:HicA family toxin-antitoxin system [Virgibacillus halotolerans]MBM7600618.1 molybdenum cofactor biosynthesis enzyme MoaA [Virgibacillus halotolerans]
MVENFEVGVVYPLRTYERHQFSFSIDGKEYKGDYHNEIIEWLNPHPKQVVDEGQLNLIEAEVYQMLGYHGVKDDIEDIEIGRMLNKAHFCSDAHRFKLRTQGEEFKGVFRDDNIDWFYPKPQGKLKHDKIEELEKTVHQKVKEHKEKEG